MEIYLKYIVLIVFVIFLIFALVKGKKKTFYFIVQSAIIEAERWIGTGEGEEKLKIATEIIRSMLPFYLRIFIGEKLIHKTIEATLDGLQDIFNRGKQE